MLRQPAEKKNAQIKGNYKCYETMDHVYFMTQEHRIPIQDRSTFFVTSLTFDPETAMSSSVLMATQVTSWSCPQRTCTGRGERPLENPP